MAESSWWRTLARGTTMLVAALAIAAFAFVLRFNALGGILGGFDNDDFATLTQTDWILAGEQPMRDFSEGELRAVWPSLTYELPALTQRLFGRTLLTHAALTCGALAACAALVFWLARGLSRSWVVGALAALTVIASTPKLYNYTKVLSLTVAVALLRWVTLLPTLPRIAVLAAWTVAATLFRHDLGVYVGVGSVVALLASEYRPRTAPLRRLIQYVGLTLLFALPSLLWIVYYGSVPDYLASLVRAVDAEGKRLAAWPVLDWSAPLATSSLVALTYYAFWGTAVFALIDVAVRWSVQRHQTMALERSFGAGLAAMVLITNFFFLRSNLPARFGDAAVPAILLVAWSASAAVDRPTIWSTARTAGACVAFTVLCFAFVQMNELMHEFATTRLRDGVRPAIAQFAGVAAGLREEPPTVWREKPVERTIAVARYLSECTAPGDRVLLGTYADEVAYFGRRLAAGGQRRFVSKTLRTESDQKLVLARMAKQSVPVVVTDLNYEREFVSDYPLIARHIESHYHDVGAVSTDGEPVLHVWVERSRHPVRVDPVLGFPCFQ